MRPAIYSGPNRSGMCICGHPWHEHHLGIVIREGGTETDGGIEEYIPQECEHYGFNEWGGLDREGKHHCGYYRDTMLPDEKENEPK